MDLGKDPSSPPSRIEPSCREFIHWYFLSAFRSRKLRALAVSSTGRSRRAVPIVLGNCGGMVLCLPIFPVFRKVFTFVVSAVPSVEQFIVCGHPVIFAAFAPASMRFWPVSFTVAEKRGGARIFPAAASVSGGEACGVCSSWFWG